MISQLKQKVEKERAAKAFEQSSFHTYSTFLKHLVSKVNAELKKANLAPRKMRAAFSGKEGYDTEYLVIYDASISTLSMVISQEGLCHKTVTDALIIKLICCTDGTYSVFTELTAASIASSWTAGSDWRRLLKNICEALDPLGVSVARKDFDVGFLFETAAGQIAVNDEYYPFIMRGIKTWDITRVVINTIVDFVLE